MRQPSLTDSVSVTSTRIHVSSSRRHRSVSLTARACRASLRARSRKKSACVCMAAIGSLRRKIKEKCCSSGCCHTCSRDFNTLSRDVGEVALRSIFFPTEPGEPSGFSTASTVMFSPIQACAKGGKKTELHKPPQQPTRRPIAPLPVQPILCSTTRWQQQQTGSEPEDVVYIPESRMCSHISNNVQRGVFWTVESSEKLAHLLNVPTAQEPHVPDGETARKAGVAMQLG